MDPTPRNPADRLLPSPSDRAVPWRLHLLLASLLPLTLLITWGASIRPDLVERLYAGRVYPWIAKGLGWAFGWTALPVAEGLALALGTIVFIRVHRALRGWRSGGRTGLNLIRHGLLQTISAFSVGIFLLMMLWGLNYWRPPLVTRIGLDTRAPAVEELVQMAREQVSEIKALGPLFAGKPEGLLDGQRPAPLDLGAVQAGYARLLPGAEVRTPKRFVGTALLDLVITSGIFVLFTGESLVNDGIPAPRIPFIAAHEAGHALGLAPEGEASFIALRACRVHPDPLWRYSGSLEAWRELLHALALLDSNAAQALSSELPEAARTDIEAQEAWSRRHSTPVGRFGRVMYGHFLNAQGQRAGLDSYHGVVMLMVGEWRARQGARPLSTEAHGLHSKPPPFRLSDDARSPIPAR